MKEKLQTETIYNALINYQLSCSDEHKTKSLQEAIYQLEDIKKNKAFVKNITKTKDIKNEACLTIDNVVQFLNTFIKMKPTVISFIKEIDGTTVHTFVKHNSIDYQECEKYNPIMGETNARVEHVSRKMFSFFLNIIELMSDTQLTYMKKIFHDEIKRRKDINKVVDKASEKILKNNIDEN